MFGEGGAQKLGPSTEDYLDAIAKTRATVSSVVSTQFEEDIEADRGLLAQAKRMGKGEKMSREQYGALQRKVGGTKGGFFGENIFARGEYLDKGYVETAEEQPVEVVAKPFLALVLVGVLATTVYVVQQVGSAGAI